jgi:hypothetical protein
LTAQPQAVKRTDAEVSVTDENQNAKPGVITAYFADVEARVAFLDDLANTGHEPEAITLCLVYIDRFAQCLCWPRASSGHNFVEALICFGGNPLLALAHPLQATRAFGAMKASWKTLAERIAQAFPGLSHEVLPIQTFEQALADYVTTAELAQLGPELWRATIANVVYQHLRNAAIHGFGISAGIVLSQTTWNGQPVPIIGLSELKSCARGLIAEARRRSEANWQWFGDDAIVHGA